MKRLGQITVKQVGQNGVKFPPKHCNLPQILDSLKIAFHTFKHQNPKKSNLSEKHFSFNYSCNNHMVIAVESEKCSLP